MLFPKTCLLFDGFRPDPFTLANLSAFREASRGVMPVVAMFHAAPGTPPFPQTGGAQIELTDEDIFDGVKHQKQPARSVTPGNSDLKLIAAVKRLPQYDRFIKVEYDVLAARRPYEAMVRLGTLAADTDFAGHNPRRHQGGDGWPHWTHLTAPNGDTAGRIENAARCFLPLMIVSRRYVETLERYLGEGWRGHFECLMPTVAWREGMAVRNLTAVKPQVTAHGAFHWLKPEFNGKPLPDFIHPVKSFAQYDALPSTVRRNLPR